MSLSKNVDVVIIGAGPAGLSAAIYLARSPLSFILLEKGAPGGKLLSIDKIANYPGVKETSGFALASSFVEEAASLGVTSTYATVQNVIKKDDGFLVLTSEGEVTCKAVIAASGIANGLKPLVGEKEFLGRGISYCATCDGAFLRGKKAVVSGSGERTYREVLFLSGLAQEVVFLEKLDSFNGDPLGERLLEEKNVQVLFGAKPLAFVGKDKAEEMTYVQNGEEKVLKADGFFPFGNESGASNFLSTLSIEKDKSFIKIDPVTYESSLPNLFVIGDLAAVPLRQVVTAASSGAIAATTCIKRLRK